MSNAGEVLKSFYAAVVRKDTTTARRYLDDNLLFIGLFETYHGPEEYIAALTMLLQVVVRLDVKRIIAEGNDVAVFFELETKAPAAAKVLVAEWHQINKGKIFRVESAFDGRPFEAMFSRGTRA
jgi:limonene-1,2-epoxide hydrolase